MHGNIMGAVATYLAMHKRHFARTLAEFEWRFNDRIYLTAMIPSLGQVAITTGPATFSNFKLAAYGAQSGKRCLNNNRSTLFDTRTFKESDRSN